MTRENKLGIAAGIVDSLRKPQMVTHSLALYFSTLVLLLISCTANEAEPQTSGTQDGDGLSYPSSLQATEETALTAAYPAPTPTMGATSPSLPTVAPTPTTPPMPTALPTPMVTAIPTLAPGTFTEAAAPF